MKDKKNPIGLDDELDIPAALDELLKIYRAAGPEAYKKFLNSDFFKMATENDPKYHPELIVKDSKNNN